MLVKTIREKLETFAPLNLAESWDNSGWQIKFDENVDVDKILLTVSVTSDVLDFAMGNDFKFIVAHHPIIFPSISKIDDKILINAIKNNIQIYSLHTNLDKVATSKALAALFDFNNIININDYVIVEKDANVDINDLIFKIKQKLGIENFTSYNFDFSKKFYNKIALCSGSGGDFISELDDNIDLYITSDIKYHQSLEKPNLTIFDVGHLNSEKPVLAWLKKLFQDENLKVTIYNELSNAKII